MNIQSKQSLEVKVRHESFWQKKFILREDREERNFFDVGEIFFFC